MLLHSAALLLAVFSFAAAKHEDPEVHMTVPQIIQYWGYPVEVYKVTTEDGFVLEVHRIPWGRNGVPSTGCRPVVFLQHGLQADSSEYIDNLPEETIGFMLADAGYDVWLGNFRGNTYGRAHTHLDPDSEKFWEFSWDEMVDYDLPAMIDFALATTNQTSVYYIGHSQGTATMFSRLASYPTFAPKIKAFFALAPIGSVAHMKGFMAATAPFMEMGFPMFRLLFGSREFLPGNEVMKTILGILCNGDFGAGLCDSLLFMIGGPETDQFNKTRSEVYFTHFPAGTSTQNMLHWVQMYKSGNVQKYDYGSEKENRQHYGHHKPPTYDYENVKTDMYLYWSPDDWMADKKDVEEYLLKKLNPAYVKKVVELQKYNHFDFALGLNAHRDIYTPIIEQIRVYDTLFPCRN